MNKKILVSPSLLACDLTQIAVQVKALEDAGADMLHLDIMDGNFVSNISFGAGMVAAIKKITRLPLDVHLMILPVRQHYQSFIDAGADFLTIHVECDFQPLEILKHIKSQGVKCGVTLKPQTNISDIDILIEHIDLLLIMSVNPGFSGQKFMPEMLERIGIARAMIDKKINKNDLMALPLLSVDGGVTCENAPEIIQKGADVLVAGNTIFSNPVGKYASVIKHLKNKLVC